MKIRGFVLTLLSITLAGSLYGCASSSESIEAPPVRTATDGGIQSASFSETSAVTFTDDPALQYDVGPMDKDAPTEFQMTDSGLRYRILRSFTGPKPKTTDEVTVHYRGWLDSGKEFDSSYKRGEPTSFRLDQVVAGWTEGLQLVGAGGMIELWIPARLGYGQQGSGGSVPPNATLHFVVELLKIN